MMEFHISRQARDTYQFSDHLFGFTGNVILADFQAARRFARRMNELRDAAHHPEDAVKASQIYAMGLIDEILHLLVARYRQQINPQLWQEVESHLQAELGAEPLETTLHAFLHDFPPLAVYRQQQDIDTYLQGETDSLPHRSASLEEMLLLWLANANPAFAPLRELFDDQRLQQDTAYPQIIAAFTRDLSATSGFGPGGESLFELLRAPAIAAPDSLEGQLAYIRQHWPHLLGPHVLRLLRSLDFLAEENKPFFPGPGPIEISTFSEDADAPEQYSPDRDWMPQLVLLAKNIYVWLDQLSKQYGRSITRIDQIPDAELATIAQRGITGLWLIGLWERSRASQRIKQIMGNPDAVASAYSLYDYVIAADLGGPEAMENLKQRAWRYGIRLASDMVPNHMAIDSHWMIEHPERFLSLDTSPFPSYTFNGPDLCDDEHISIAIEDHYYDHSDAAVVCKRVDHRTGDTRYIYHGNDGTGMPWNDTAQLNYLDPNVREVVIQTILHVAHQFPIIRFDAAMTLAKRHIQRLWFPEPGSGGDIPSRAEHGLSKAEFDALMPQEFWRQVVDRVAVEAPDTLLLAEAFWMLEGYFVRTLGMHRVYNSAFMHMLHHEDNDKYRQLIKNTLEFDPEILKRYVNFMSNPDEETAIDQFGKDDKYFGVCTILATMPGLPMFGHGQFEGFAEKYGMEYRRAYYDEQPDPWLIDRHLRQITPLLQRRHLFADVQNFLLYDFFTPGGQVDENVLAISNRVGNERALVLTHNTFAHTRGRIRLSAAHIDKQSPAADKPLVQKTLAQGLDIPDAPHSYLIFRELNTGLEFIHNCQQVHEQGLSFELGAYQKFVFLDFRIVHDDARGSYGRLHAHLQGAGVSDIHRALTRLHLQPLHTALSALIDADNLAWLYDQRTVADVDPPDRRWYELEAKLLAFLQQAQLIAKPDAAAATTADPLDTGILQRRLAAMQNTDAAATAPTGPENLTTPPPSLPELATQIRRELQILTRLPGRKSKKQRKLHRRLQSRLDDPLMWAVSVCWVVLHRLGAEAGWASPTGATLVDDWLLDDFLRDAWLAFGVAPDQLHQGITLLKALLKHPRWYEDSAKKHAATTDVDAHRSLRLLKALLADDAVQQCLDVNKYDGVLWYRQEAMPLLLHGLLATSAIQLHANDTLSPQKLAKKLRKRYKVLRRILKTGRQSGYQVDKLLQALR